jgi:hypothetical protein
VLNRQHDKKQVGVRADAATRVVHEHEVAAHCPLCGRQEKDATYMHPVQIKAVMSCLFECR